MSDTMTDRDEQTVEELRDELRDRDLKVSGTKDELIQRLEDDEQSEEEDGSPDGDAGRSSGLTAVVARISSELAEITGLRVEGVKGLSRSDEGGWEAVVDLVEVARVPPSMDVLAGYAVTAESDGTVVGFERVHRFRRSEAAS